MKKNIWCFLGFHKFSEWKFIKEHRTKIDGDMFIKEIIDDELHSTCMKCGKVDVYIGSTDVCMSTGKKTPYTYKC